MITNTFMKLCVWGSPIKGLVTKTTFAGEILEDDYWDVIQFEHAISTPAEVRGSGRTVHSPIKITRRVDKASPIIQQALSRHLEVEAEIIFGGPDAQGAGQNKIYYKILIKGGRVTARTHRSFNRLVAADSRMPDCEVVEIAYNKITFEAPDVGVEFEDKWNSGFDD